jgi:hypothetical protein
MISVNRTALSIILSAIVVMFPLLGNGSAASSQKSKHLQSTQSGIRESSKAGKTVRSTPKGSAVANKGRINAIDWSHPRPEGGANKIDWSRPRPEGGTNTIDWSYPRPEGLKGRHLK